MTRNITIFKLLLSFFGVVFSVAVFGQGKLSTEQLNENKLPNGIKYEGKIKNAVRWIDSLGDNVVIITETGLYQSKKFKHENEGADAELFAYHFLIKNNTATQTWKVYDFIYDCPVDVEASYIKNTFQVTDLNNDGIGEIWLMYKTVCHGDTSPYDMKIIMYQGRQKFAMRGQNKVFEGTDDAGNKHYQGGEYKLDKAFIEGPKMFIEFAEKLWNKNIMQTWGD